MKKILLRIMMVICALLAVLPMTTSYAAVDFTEDGAADRVSVYVAGTPDCFPVESYDPDSATYIGAAPAFLKLVAEQSDLNFVYIRAGEQDRRATLARNNQVDLLFATEEESVLLELGVENVRLFSITRNDKPTDVYCVFTSVSGEKERETIRSVAEALTKDEIARLLTEDSSKTVSMRRFRIILIVLGSVLLCAVIALIVFLVLFFRRKHKKEAYIDSATDIGNKKYFLQAFGSMISDQTREIYYVIHFAFPIEWVNENYGTDESDEILKYAADTITQRIKDNEFCARIGGGSFAAAIYSSDVTQVERRVEEILRVLNAYGEKYKEGELKTLFHAGICALAIDDKNVEKVLYNADQAYHRALEEKKDYVFVNHDVLNEYRTKVSIREQAREALEQHAFAPYVQFIVNAKDGTICGGELLSRWDNRLYGLLTPGSYIPILQDMGLIVSHDLMMFEEACKLLEQWQQNGKKYFLTCNLTRVTISNQYLVEKIMSIAGRYSFAKDNMILEVTEDSLEENKESALYNIQCLKEQGFRVALDDFSSGYTAVANLYEYDVNLVKLDRQMIINSEHDPHATDFMKEVIRMCHELKILVLAEGVENEMQAKIANTVLCDYVQGYFYARPLPLREINSFEENYHAKVIPESEKYIGDLVVTTSDEIIAEVPSESISREVKEVSVAEDEPQTQEVTANESSPVTAPITDEQSCEEPQQEDCVESQTEEEKHVELCVSCSNGNSAVSQNENVIDKNMIHIQFGPYRLDLPGRINIDPVSELLKAIQERMEDQ